MTPYDNDTLRTFESVAYSTGEEKSASFLARDSQIIEAHAAIEGVEILPIAVALKKYPWLNELSYSLVPRDRDEYVKEVARNGDRLGYFIRIKAGQKVTLPLYTCYMIDTDHFTQCTHNIVIAEAGSEAHLISGCASNAHTQAGRHLGVSEYFIQEGALITSTMIHSWGKDVEVFPRSAAHIAKEGRFVSSYVALGPVRRIEMEPTAVIDENGLGEFYSVVYAPEGSFFDLGSTAVLNGKGASTQIISRVVSGGGNIITRGKIIGKHPHGRGTMACNGLLLKPDGSIRAVPELIGENPDLELSHEASVGMISKEELSYLMASGIEEEQAKSMIIEGFLDLHIPLLPDYLQRRINDIVAQTKLAETI